MSKRRLTQLPLAKLIDIPPVWLAVMCGFAWLQSRYFDFGLSFGGVWVGTVGAILIVFGLILMLLAVFEMQRQRTTVIPHLEAARLVTSGIFTRSRNPIYFGDVLVLLGLILRWDAVLALAFVLVFIGILRKRFIEPEENRLSDKFGSDFKQYCQKVRRWI